MKFDAEVKELPERNAACIRHIGPYPEIGKAFENILAWAGPKGLIQFPKTQVLAVYRDDPKEVNVGELRSDACLTVPEGTKADGDVQTMKIPGGLFAVAHVEIDPSEYGDAWDRLLGEWIPESDYEPDYPSDRLCYELYLNDPDQHPEKKHVVDICEPVREK
jgi:AraC family transcriptional regulator